MGMRVGGLQKGFAHSGTHRCQQRDRLSESVAKYCGEHYLAARKHSNTTIEVEAIVGTRQSPIKTA